MTDPKKTHDIAKAKGRPMLTWVGKKPLARVAVLSDVPERKQDLVNGRYELPAPPAGSTVAVKIIDMLGEEALWTYQVG